MSSRGCATRGGPHDLLLLLLLVREFLLLPRAIFSHDVHVSSSLSVVFLLKFLWDLPHKRLLSTQGLTRHEPDRRHVHTYISNDGQAHIFVFL